MRHVGGKRGLLSAVFDHGWRLLNKEIAQRVRKTSDPIAALETVFATVTEFLHRDQDLAYLFLFEGRRIREGLTTLSCQKAIGSSFAVFTS